MFWILGCRLLGSNGGSNDLSLPGLEYNKTDED